MKRSSVRVLDHERGQGTRPRDVFYNKRNDCYFGIKAHIRVDVGNGFVHSLVTMTANVHHSLVSDELFHGKEKSVWAKKGYVCAYRKTAFNKVDELLAHKAPKGCKLGSIDEKINCIVAMLRAKVGHPVRAIKCQFNHVKTRCRGLAKNRAYLFALCNLFFF